MSNLNMQALDDHMRENGDPEGVRSDDAGGKSDLVERLRLIAAWDTHGGPTPHHKPDKQSTCTEAAAEIELLRVYVRQADERGDAAMHRVYVAEAQIADMLMVLRMVDDNHRVDAGEKRKAWSGRFVVDEVRRVLAVGVTGSDLDDEEINRC